MRLNLLMMNNNIIYIIESMRKWAEKMKTSVIEKLNERETAIGVISCFGNVIHLWRLKNTTEHELFQWLFIDLRIVNENKCNNNDIDIFKWVRSLLHICRDIIFFTHLLIIMMIMMKSLKKKYEMSILMNNESFKKNVNIWKQNIRTLHTLYTYLMI